MVSQRKLKEEKEEEEEDYSKWFVHFLRFF